MKHLKGYSIPFAGLSDGWHHFDFEINDAFLAHFEHSLVNSARATVEVELEKRSGFMKLLLRLHGTVRSICDVCMEEFDLAIEGDEQIMVKIVDILPTEDSVETDVIYLQKGDNTLYLSQPIYELLTLSIPMRIVHPEDEQGNPTCDPAVLRYLQENSPKTDKKTAAEDDDQGGNSIWKALQSLKKQ